MITPAIVSLFLSAAAAPAAPAPPPAQPCALAERHQLDFWIGEWDVYPAAAPTRLVAHSRIESVYDGCAIRESWMPLKGSGGGSYSAYVPELKRWRQIWVDSSGAWAEFTGGLTDNGLSIQGAWPQPGAPKQVTRMTYRKLADGAVQQLGETTDDNGKTWQPSFDFTYRPRAKTAG